MRRLVLTHVTVKSGGVLHPPGSRLRLHAHDVAAMGGHVTVLDDEPEGEASETGTGGSTPAAGGDVAPEGSRGEREDHKGSGEPESRVAAVVAALDLLEEGDFDAEGQPDRVILASALGFEPTDEEVGAALKVHAEGV